ncbi:hypothetical protein BREVNS_1504 [Brevinematales bacterium NS]|nr:hypothetical protein BREVNS_1504 [Brevinematales bacterium NS]
MSEYLYPKALTPLCKGFLLHNLRPTRGYFPTLSGAGVTSLYAAFSVYSGLVCLFYLKK